jgi:L-alanine-DL-glutamate epimerase-like enolase superfamily enzyme
MTLPNEHLRRASSLTQEHAFANGPRITAIETLIPFDVMNGLMLLRIHSDAGTAGGEPVIGHGETYYIPQAVAAVLHDWMARRLLGADATAIESHWRFFYERGTAFGVRGCELRAISAIDLALWDILGQLTQQPIWKLLGGPVRSSIPVYNSCGGPSYGRKTVASASANESATSGWPGHGDLGQPGPLEDNYNSIHNPADLAEELLAEGYTAMKLWSFDRIFRQSGGHRISWTDLDEGLQPFRAIRDRVGWNMEIMLDGHGFFSLPAALRIADAMQELKPLWLEDVIRPDCVDTIADFRDRAGVPIAVSEMLVSREEYRQVLQRRAADYTMIDPTWIGGISETRRATDLAQAFNVPVLMHDCTGPLTLFAGLHVSAACANVTYQETVRAHVRTFYPHLIDEPPKIQKGHIELPTRPGLSVRLRDDLFQHDHPGYRISRL